MVHGKNPKFGPEEYLFMACFLSFFFDPNFGEPTEMKNFWPDALLTARWMAVTAASQAVFEEKVVFPDKYSPLHQKMARIILRSKIPAIIWERGTRDEPQIRYSIARNLVSGSARASIDREACQNGPGWALPLYTPDSWAVLSEYRDCVFEGAPVAQEYIHSCYCAGVLRLPKGLLNT